MSIARAQAAALAEGFLDSIGDENGIRPKETITQLIVLAGGMVDDMQQNLNSSNSNASGSLSASINATEPTLNGKTVKVEIEMLFYGLFLNKGVKGTKSGSGAYQFKGDYPPKKMVDAIREWSKHGKLSTKNTNRHKTISRQEKKNVSIGDLDNSYAVARSILQHGIKPTAFLDKAVLSTQKRVGSQLGAALKVDIINSFKV